MKNYKEQYLDPRWQKKRLEILERDNWACEYCSSQDKTLHVHHKAYITGKDVWDYPNNLLVTLCEECHKKEKYSMDKAIIELTNLFKKNFLSGHIHIIAEYMQDFKFSNFNYIDEVVAHIIGWSLTDKKMNKLMQKEYFKRLIKDNENATN